MNPEISIIVPVYNVETYIHRCIRSILSQTFEKFELILVDDGSKDNSSQICDEFAEKDSRVKVIHKENGGLSSARNAGIDIAKGTYLGFVDSDDYINKNMYEILYKSIITNSSDITVCDFIRVNENEKYKEDDSLNDAIVESNYTNIEVLNEIYCDNGIQFITAWNKLYNRKLFNRLRYVEGRIHEDQFMAHKILFLCKKVTYIKKPLYYYIQTSNSIMRSKFNIKRLDGVYSLKDRVDFFRGINQKQLQYKAEYDYIEEFFDFYYRAQNEVENAGREINQMRKIFVSDIFILLKNPLYNWKEKSLWISFCINPRIYKLYKENAT